MRARSRRTGNASKLYRVAVDCGASTDEIFETVMEVVDLQERYEPRVFIRRDPYERYMSILIYLPRDLYNTAARERVQSVLREVYHAHTVDFDVPDASWSSWSPTGSSAAG